MCQKQIWAMKTGSERNTSSLCPNAADILMGKMGHWGVDTEDRKMSAVKKLKQRTGESVGD